MTLYYDEYFYDRSIFLGLLLLFSVSIKACNILPRNDKRTSSHSNRRRKWHEKMKILITHHSQHHHVKRTSSGRFVAHRSWRVKPSLWSRSAGRKEEKQWDEEDIERSLKCGDIGRIRLDKTEWGQYCDDHTPKEKSSKNMRTDLSDYDGAFSSSFGMLLLIFYSGHNVIEFAARQSQIAHFFSVREIVFYG